MLNFMKFINENTAFSQEEKIKLLDDFCYSLGYMEMINNEDIDLPHIQNPESKVDFANRMISNYIKYNVEKYRRKEAEKIAALNLIWENLDL